jgi:uncharacterized membrane protein
MYNQGGLYRFGILPGYIFIFMIIISILIVTLLIPATIIYYVIQVPSTSTQCNDNEKTAEIHDDDFDGW